MKCAIWGTLNSGPTDNRHNNRWPSATVLLPPVVVHQPSVNLFGLPGSVRPAPKGFRMSHIPVIVAQLARAAREATESLGAFPGNHTMPVFTPLSQHHIPLSERPARDLWARANELARMAATATTFDARIALQTLAARFAALAAKRELIETMELSDVPDRRETSRSATSGSGVVSPLRTAALSVTRGHIGAS